MNIATFLMGLVGPLALRAIAAVGFTAVTYTGVQVLVNALIEQVQSTWSTVPAAMFQIASLCGVPESLGIICGAFLARITLWQISQATKLIFTGRTA